MKTILKILFSSVTTMILLFLLITAMGTATFIEDKYDTVTARTFVYDAFWFELIFILLIVNLTGHISRYKMLSRKKWPSLLFHLAFIVIIIGAGITRYFGFEGTMHIREGQTTNVIYTQTPYLKISVTDKEQQFNYDEPFIVSNFIAGSLHREYLTKDHGRIEFDYYAFIRNAVERIKYNVPGGKKIIALVAADENQQQDQFLYEGHKVDLGAYSLAFNGKPDPGTIIVKEVNGSLAFTAPFEIIRTRMMTKASDTIPAGTQAELSPGLIYRSNGIAFMFNGFYQNAGTELVSGSQEETGTDVLLMHVTINNRQYKATVPGGPEEIMQLQDFSFDGVPIKIGYGEKPVGLPFSLRLNDFILDRYAGSMSPSSYASEVTLIDDRKGLKEDHRIFMNNVLDYGMYRFFQSSYDQDEKGTILSVNHDFFGTLVTYIGYFMLSLGFVLTLFNRNSRFHELSRKISEFRLRRKAGLIISGIFLVMGSSCFSQAGIPKPVSQVHAEKFGRLLVQTFDGRFEPVHSMAYDVMHKISRKDQFNLAGKGEMNAMQILLDMMLEPEFWQQQKIIYVREKPVQEILGITGKYASFLDFFDQNRHYKLQKYAEQAFRKKQSAQNSFDKEVIRVDERVNVLEMAFRGSMLKLFPETGAVNNKWISWDDKAAADTLTGPVTAINKDLHLNALSFKGIMYAYFNAASEATVSGDYSKADRIIGYISEIQRNSPGGNLLASETKISVEILYNKLRIFVTLRNVYAVLSIVLLLLAFTDNLRPQKNRMISIALNGLVALLGLAFLYHTFGLVLRWYLTGHAPWSNGYESLLLISWGGLFAGFMFARYSRIALAATALLAFFVLMTASHSSYDPQLTNLQPVLKSYWLIIHVATLTISYGFLGLGFILGLINLVICLLKTRKNNSRLDLIIAELTGINEMNLIIGVMMATVGTFLGGVWANESWGRYWGWDAKETWALVIVVTYTLILHLRFIPKARGNYLFNAASVIGFGSVLMTFVGVNYYLSKGLHSYGAGDTIAFPLWAWALILSVITLIAAAGLRQMDLAEKDQLRG